MKTVNYEALKAQMDKTLTFAKVPHGDAGIEANIVAWGRAKGNLIETLRKHPGWNEDAMAVIIPERVTEGVSVEEVIDKCAQLCEKLREERLINVATNWQYEGPTWRNLAVQNLSNTDVERLNSTGWGRYEQAKVGQKTSRYIRKLLLNMGTPRNCAPAWKAYAELADTLNPVTITRPLVISINPSDYLMMSYGDNWSSCHIINPEIVDHATNHYSGQSKIGCLAYMVDSCSIITYTVNALPEDLSDLPITHRHTRQMFMLHQKNPLIMQSRMYPYTHDHALIDVRRTIMQGVIAQCLSLPNLWRKKNTYDGFETNGMQYPDYEYVDEYEISVSYQASGEFGYAKEQPIGDTALCVRCGRKVSANDSVICYKCSNELICAYCGEPINVDDEDSYRVIDGRRYHCHCTYWCDHCGEYHSMDVDHVEVEGVGIVCHDALHSSDEYVCFWMRSGHKWIRRVDLPEVFIEICGEYFGDGDAARNRGYEKCARCGYWHSKWEMWSGHDGRKYCDKCCEETMTSCEHGHEYTPLIHRECPMCATERLEAERRQEEEREAARLYHPYARMVREASVSFGAAVDRMDF